MALFDHTAARIAPTAPRRPGLLARLLVWNRAWVEHRRLGRLDADARRDMGLPEDVCDIALREIAARMMDAAR